MPARSASLRCAAVLSIVLSAAVCPPLAAAEPIDFIRQATDYPERWQRDLTRDLTSHPSEILAFSGVAPGMQVLDLFSGGGYWSELFARAVGSKGRVVAHTNSAYRGFTGKLADQRFAAGRVPHVKTLTSELDDLELGRARFDLIFISLAYHDLYFHADFWPQPGRERFFRQLRDALKADGILIVIDHAAAAGTGNAHAQSLHRIDEVFARKDIEAAGFEFVAASEVLRNSHDDHTLEVFDSAIRNRTDRFVYRFRKAPDPDPVLATPTR